MTDSLTNFLQGVALAYDALPHTPTDRATLDAYDALKRGLLVQYRTIPYRVRFTSDNPYQTARDMMKEVAAFHTLYVYTGGELPADHPLSAPIECNAITSGPAYDGITYNHIFRAVHDGLIHIPHGLGFTASDEFRAFQLHAAMFVQPFGRCWGIQTTYAGKDSAAVLALATETLAQIAWFYYGPRSHETPRPYAPQKAGLLPVSTVIAALNFTL